MRFLYIGKEKTKIYIYIFISFILSLTFQRQMYSLKRFTLPFHKDRRTTAHSNSQSLDHRFLDNRRNKEDPLTYDHTGDDMRIYVKTVHKFIH